MITFSKLINLEDLVAYSRNRDISNINIKGNGNRTLTNPNIVKATISLGYKGNVSNEFRSVCKALSQSPSIDDSDRSFFGGLQSSETLKLKNYYKFLELRKKYNISYNFPKSLRQNVEIYCNEYSY